MKSVLTLTAALGITAAAASADVLWDQSTLVDVQPDGVAGPGDGGVFNMDSGTDPFSGIQQYAASDVSVGAGGWNINSITQWYDLLFSDNSLFLNAVKISIFPKTGPLPAASDDPIAGSQVITVPAALDVTNSSITASGLNINLAPGEYWVNMTALANPGSFISSFQAIQSITSDVYGDDSATFGFGAWSAVNYPDHASNDLAIKIEGTQVPAPTGAALLALSGMAATRRRR